MQVNTGNSQCYLQELASRSQRYHTIDMTPEQHVISLQNHVSHATIPGQEHVAIEN